MKKSNIPIVIAIMVTAAFILSACASHKEPPDPIAFQEEISENLAKEVDLVQSTVLNVDHADRVIALLRERDRIISSHVKVVVAYREEMSALNADYDAKRESFDRLLSSYNNQREAAQKEIFGVIPAFKTQTTVNEWKVISKYQLKKLHPRQAYPEVKGGV
jgi:hypothetical protein